MTLLLECCQIVPAFMPVDTQTGANTGDWVSLKNYKHVAIVYLGSVGTAGDDPVLTISQATDVAGTSTKALNINANKAFKKQAATNLLAVGQWSSASADVSTNTLTNGTGAEQQEVYVVEFDSDELDVDGGFDCVQASVPDTGSAGAQLGACLYILCEPRYPDAATAMASAIVD